MDVGIAGAGIAGLTTALTLNGLNPQLMDDVRIQLFERSSAPGEAGAGIQISPNGCSVLDRLGLLDPLVDISSAPVAIRIVSARNQRCHVTVPLGSAAVLRYGYPYLTVHRQALHELLHSAVTDQIGQDAILFDAGVDEVIDHPDHGLLRLTTGEQMTLDLVVGADGIHSSVRDVVGEDVLPRFTGHVAWRGVVPQSVLSKASPITETITSWMAPGCHAVTYPLGDGRINIVFVEEEHDWQSESWTVRGDVEMLKERVQHWHPDIRALVASLSEVYRWALFDRPVPSQWYGHHVVLVGDSCHAMLPYAAQGAVMAIEDAEQLAVSLVGPPSTASKGSARGLADFSSALADYQRHRIQRVRWVQALARRHGQLFHLNKWASAAARLGMRILNTSYPAYFQKRNDWLMGYQVPPRR